MEIALFVVSILLIAIVLLQSGKADGASNALTGANSSLFANRKERGGELFITRVTYLLGLALFIISMYMNF